MLLAAATPGVKARLASHRRGLGTNLYLLLIGDSTRSRKSTSLEFAAELAEGVDAECVLPDRASPEGMIQELAVRSGRTSLWLPDEFGEHYKRLKKKDEDILELLLRLYDGRDYSKRRHAKRIRGGGTVEDVDRVTKPHLSILGTTTPTIFDALTSSDVESGFLPRFAFVVPSGTPPRRPQRLVSAEADQGQVALRDYLARLAFWSSHFPNIEVAFSERALEIVDGYEEHIEDSSLTILKRLPTMAYKLS